MLAVFYAPIAIATQVTRQTYMQLGIALLLSTLSQWSHAITITLCFQ